jgi:hypothetical protein
MIISEGRDTKQENFSVDEMVFYWKKMLSRGFIVRTSQGLALNFK